MKPLLAAIVLLATAPHATAQHQLAQTVPAPAPAQPQWYVIVWSCQNHGLVVRPSCTHTWAVWARVQDGKIVDRVEINWGPRGHQSCAHSVEDARARGYAIRRWVLSTDAVFFEAARAQREALKSYRALDRLSRPLAVNCLHSVSDVAGYLDTGPLCGIAGGQAVVNHFVRQGRARPSTEYWLANLIEEGR